MESGKRKKEPAMTKLSLVPRLAGVSTWWQEREFTRLHGALLGMLFTTIAFFFTFTLSMLVN
jgi:hypothetical protein